MLCAASTLQSSGHTAAFNDIVSATLPELVEVGRVLTVSMCDALDKPLPNIEEDLKVAYKVTRKVIEIFRDISQRCK